MAKLNQNENNQINKIQCENFFYLVNKLIAQLTCYTESLFLTSKKISKKAVKLGSFLQGSLHILPEHDGCFWKLI